MLNVTISIGIATLGEGEGADDQVLIAADNAMFEAKRQRPRRHQPRSRIAFARCSAGAAGIRGKQEACTEPGHADRSDGKNGAERAGAGHVVCDGRPRLVLEGGSVGDVQALRFVAHGSNFAPGRAAYSPAHARVVVRLALPRLVGSAPAIPNPRRSSGYYQARADVAQLVEHFTRNEGVRGSSPRVGFQDYCAIVGELRAAHHQPVACYLDHAGEARSELALHADAFG